MTQEINIVEAPDSGKKKIGVLCLAGLETFIKPIVAHWEEQYNVRAYYGNSLHECVSIVDFSDVVFLEWANQMAIEVSQKVPQLKDKKVILRVHSYEVLSGFLTQINWAVISKMIFVANHIRDIAIKQIPQLPKLVDIHVVANGV